MVDWVEWMNLVCKWNVVEELAKNMENMFVLQDEEEQSCHHKMNYAQLVNKIGGYIKIDMAALTHQYCIMDYASKRMKRKCFEPYLLTLLQLPHLFDMLLPNQIMKNNHLWYAPFDHEDKTLHQILDFYEPAKHPILHLES